MEPKEKPKFSFLRLAVISAIVILTALAVGGATWYVMDGQAERDKGEFEKQIQELEDQKSIEEGAETTGEITKKSDTGLTLSDKETLIVLTVRRYENDSFIPAVKVDKLEGEWAITIPVPLKYSEADGYNVPAMGGSQYLWRKVNGTWTYIGSASEGGWDPAVKKLFDDIPTSIIPSSARVSE